MSYKTKKKKKENSFFIVIVVRFARRLKSKGYFLAILATLANWTPNRVCLIRQVENADIGAQKVNPVFTPKKGPKTEQNSPPNYGFCPMNLEKALVAKLKGAKIDCRDCKYHAQTISKHEKGVRPSLIAYCAKHLELKTDKTLCSDFEGLINGRQKWVHGRKESRAFFHSPELSDSDLGALYEHHKSSGR